MSSRTHVHNLPCEMALFVGCMNSKFEDFDRAITWVVSKPNGMPIACIICISSGEMSASRLRGAASSTSISSSRRCCFVGFTESSALPSLQKQQTEISLVVYLCLKQSALKGPKRFWPWDVLLSKAICYNSLPTVQSKPKRRRKRKVRTAACWSFVLACFCFYLLHSVLYKPLPLAAFYHPFLSVCSDPYMTMTSR